MRSGLRNCNEAPSSDARRRQARLIAQSIERLRSDERSLEAELEAVRSMRKDLEALLNKHAPIERPSLLQPGRGAVRVDSTPSRADDAPSDELMLSVPSTKQSLPERVLAELDNGPQTIASLIENLGITDKTEQDSMRTAVYRLSKRGKIKGAKEGRAMRWQKVE